MNNNIRYIIAPAIALIWFVAIAASVVVHHSTSILQCEGLIAVSESVCNGRWPIILNSVAIVSIALLLNFLWQHNEMSKSENLLPLLFFTLFQALTPSLIQHHLYTHLTTLLLVVVITILYTCYQQHRSAVEKVFIMGLLLSLISLFSAHIVYFLPLILIGLIQMQVASIRTFAAMLVGLITPYWIIWGMGWIDTSQWNISAFAVTLQTPTLHRNVLPCAAVMAIGLFTGFSNMLNALNENNKTRAKNGFINIASVYTAVLLMIDNSQSHLYIPMLNSCVALQACYFFTSRQGRTYNILYYALVALLIGATAYTYFS